MINLPFFKVLNLDIPTHIKYWIIKNKQIPKHLLEIIDQTPPITLENTLALPLENFKIHGRTTQNGEPTPENPIPIENVEGNIEINVCNKNCLDVNGLTIINRGLEWTGNSDGSIVVNGEASSSSSYGFQMTPKLKIGTYVLSIRESVLYKLKMRLHKKVSNTFIYATIQIGDTLSSSFNIDEEIDYCQFYIDSGISLGNAINFTFYPQLEEGTTATQYEEHKEQTILFPLATNQKLMEGDYFADDGIHHKRIQVIYDGKEDWRYEYKTYYLNLSTTAKTFSSFDPNNVLAISTHFQWGNGQSNNFKYGAFWYTTNGLKLRLQYDENGDVNSFKSWLASLYANNTPLIVEYERNEETIDPYTPAQAEAYNNFKNLHGYNNITIVNATSSNLKPNVSLKYYAKG